MILFHCSACSLLLNHDTAQRPSSQELLQSKHMPPPVLVEQRMQQVVRYTLSNPQMKGLACLVALFHFWTLSYRLQVPHFRVFQAVFASGPRHHLRPRSIHPHRRTIGPFIRPSTRHLRQSFQTAWRTGIGHTFADAQMQVQRKRGLVRQFDGSFWKYCVLALWPQVSL